MHFWRLLPITQGTMSGTTAPRALVVDDAPENRMLVSALLVQQGFHVDQAADGEAAVRAASLESWT